MIDVRLVSSKGTIQPFNDRAVVTWPARGMLDLASAESCCDPKHTRKDLP